MKIVWSDLAIGQLKEIQSFFAKDSPDTADNVISEILDRADQLLHFSESGPEETFLHRLPYH